MKLDLKSISITIWLLLQHTWINASQDLASVQVSKQTFDIPAQSASHTLGLIARKSNTPLLFSYNKVKSVKANKVKGVFSVLQALDVALADTGLKAFINNDGVILVKQI